MATRSFTHLHTHTEFSMLDGASRVQELVAAAAADGQPALGITDHGNMYGVLDFYAACRAAGINPVIGTEAYMAGESRHERPVRRGRVDDTGGDVEGGEKLYYHLTLLAESNEGYRNLLKLSSAAYLEGYYYKPRVDWELLARHAKGLIATTGCLGGVVLQALLADDHVKAESLAGRLQDVFGRGNLFVELQDHGLAAQHKTNPALVEIARRIGAPLLATNDSHYIHRQDHVTQDALLCVQTGATIDDPKRFKFEGDEHYLKTAAEMRHLFAELPEACDNTLLIAERANVEIDFGRPSLPRFPIPPEHAGATDEEGANRYLRHLTFEGAGERYGDPLPAAVSDRLDRELGIIADMGFSAYFLVVWDLIRYARSRQIRVGPGRGSAAGCCVAYCLRIVDVDPIRYDLIFERFLNPGRRQMPDIDMDFDERYRAEMIRYAAERYGSDHVAQIVTFSTIKARAAVRDAARVLGYPYVVGDKIAKAMPPLLMGRDTPLAACLTRTEGHEDGFAAAGELRGMYETDAEAKQVIDVARGLEGLRRQDGIHAAAVVITDEPLTEYLPIQRKPDGSNPEDAPVVTQYEMHGVEDLGLLKMDFLGLRNLSVIERTLDLVELSSGTRPDIDAIPLDDEATFAMLCRGDSMGVFQLEGGPMRSLMRSLAPSSFDDVAALVALYRPGPMAANMHRQYADRKNGRAVVDYPHPDLEALLGDTYGLMIYQESMMRVAQRIAGYDLAEADNLRKACGKKSRFLIAEERQKFVAGCVSQGYDESLGTSLFDIIEPFADYAFNKSHAYGYGFIAYQTAWLKAHHPVEYLASLLTSVKDNKDKTATYLAECRALGIEVQVPDVNRSLAEFAPAAAVVVGTGVEDGGVADDETADA
ncbi:MAG: DNA polymerase III subunit alpha, partial [Acidimicrobiales bacterium]